MKKTVTFLITVKILVNKKEEAVCAGQVVAVLQSEETSAGFGLKCSFIAGNKMN